MKKILLTIVLFVASSFAIEFGANLQAGFALVNLYNGHEPGFTVHGGGSVHFTRVFSMELELGYTPYYSDDPFVVYKIEGDRYEPIEAQNHKYIRDMIDFPLLCRFTIPTRRVRPQFYGGVYLGVSPAERYVFEYGGEKHDVDGENYTLSSSNNYPADSYQEKEAAFFTGWAGGFALEIPAGPGYIIADLRYTRCRQLRDDLGFSHSESLTLGYGITF